MQEEPEALYSYEFGALSAPPCKRHDNHSYWGLKHNMKSVLPPIGFFALLVPRSQPALTVQVICAIM